MKTCPNCKEGYIQAFSKISPVITCDICGGTGELPEGVEFDRDKGCKIFYMRFDEALSLKNYCLKYDLDAVERSREERGFFKKD